jgi:uncharacterized protein (TIGR02145 family)
VNGTKREHYGKQKEQFCDPRDGKKYVYVEIGTQTWMAENLIYDVSGNICNDSSCLKYGRLYDWIRAMALPSSCELVSCVSANPKGICPSGWHLPSIAEWGILYHYADSTSGTSIIYNSPKAGRYLKAASGWNNGGNGEDTYGFSALPGGHGNSYGSFGNVGDGGHWWSSSEDTSWGASYVDMFYNSDYAYYGTMNKDRLYSVRCVKD